MRRQIIYSNAFDDAVEQLGGYRTVDVAIDTIVESLGGNPFAFPKFESDFISFRYARTRRIGVIPPLYVVFTIDRSGNVTLEHVEEDIEVT